MAFALVAPVVLTLLSAAPNLSPGRLQLQEQTLASLDDDALAPGVSELDEDHSPGRIGEFALAGVGALAGDVVALGAGIGVGLLANAIFDSGSSGQGGCTLLCFSAGEFAGFVAGGGTALLLGLVLPALGSAAGVSLLHLGELSFDSPFGVSFAAGVVISIVTGVISVLAIESGPLLLGVLAFRYLAFSGGVTATYHFVAAPDEAEEPLYSSAMTTPVLTVRF